MFLIFLLGTIDFVTKARARFFSKIDGTENYITKIANLEFCISVFYLLHTI